jgi:hypothetical protein
MSKLGRGTDQRVHQRRMYGVLALLASILTLAAIWNMPSDSSNMQSAPAH